MIYKLITIILLLVVNSLNAQYKFVLSGGFGVGKTTIINLLEQNGYTTVPEACTILLNEAKQNNEIEKYKASYYDPEFRIKLMEKQLSFERTLDRNNYAFLDKSTIDVIAFADYDKVKLPRHILDIPNKDRYSIVFFIEPLPKEIFKKTEFGSYEKSLEIHEFIKKFYKNMGCNIIEVPFDTPEQRMRFILKHVCTKLENDLIKPIWDNRADEWTAHLSNLQKDINRFWQSDPVMWQLLSNVKGLTILDVGCGQGYISRKLADQGANVIATDISSKLISIAKEKSKNYVNLEYRIESCSNMRSIFSATIDKILCNYVLMDIPDLESTAKEFNRVLKINGEAVIIISHPCFPMENIQKTSELLLYGWKFPYFKEHIMKLPKWDGFSDGFTIFHRPLSTYWKIFKQNGFDVIEFQEPTLSEEARKQLDSQTIKNYEFVPHAVAFLLRKIR